MQYPLSHYLKHLKNDIPSSLVVFLVALPLCLGIALASGAPLLSGLVTGIVGGLVVALLSGSQLAVSGPAAGLTVIVLSGIERVGTFEGFLCAVILAGIIQVVLGFAKAGTIGLYFPSSVIKGMLSAIGLILILKQIPHFLGIDADFFGDIAFFQPDGRNTFSEIWYAVSHVAGGAAIIGLVSLSLLYLWERPLIKRSAFTGILPGALIAVILGVLLNIVFKNFFPALEVSPEHLVSIPEISSLTALGNELQFPDFSFLLNKEVLITAFTIAMIASLETLLSIEAIDKLDPARHRTPYNRELKAQGVGNIIAGFLGGIPMTAVIVRGSTNISAGGKTKASAFLHGFFLLGSVLLIPHILNLIPLSALAAVLLSVGYKLTKPKLFKAQWKLGKEQFIPFMVTIVAILFTDLLIGIIIGMSVGVYFILKANYSTPYFFSVEESADHKSIKVHLSEHVTFLNKANITLFLEKLPENCTVEIDGDNAHYIDYDVLEAIYDFQETAREKNIKMILRNLPGEGERGGINVNHNKIHLLPQKAASKRKWQISKVFTKAAE